MDEMEVLIECYIELAYTAPPSKEKRSSAQPFPASIKRRAKTLRYLPVVSAVIVVDPSGRYDGRSDLPLFESFEGNIEYPGGINAPKKIEVKGSDGVVRRELVKSGLDDLRQDAVMQQIFTFCNSILESNANCRTRGLRMNTFKVVPFTPTAGVIEWVDSTLPLVEWLAGKDRVSGAHLKYSRPGSWDYRQCHVAMAADRRPRTHEELRAAYDRCCSRFHPVLHHFFLERFREPALWLEKRLAYTRSVAVSSIVGYIIGLGDRHLANILVSVTTAEVVHIDLGIAFDAGQHLPTPETVPFRLTRDLVDGMGVTGVEGPMRRSCESTMLVLRENKEAILTIVEVFLHDPLYKWTMTVKDAARRQLRRGGIDGEEINDDDDLDDDGSNAFIDDGGGVGDGGTGSADAERTILRVRAKLDGRAFDDGDIRGVEGQVQELLREAQDPDRLCRLYVGWAPWL